LWKELRKVLSRTALRVLKFLFGETKAEVRAGICILVCLPAVISSAYPGSRLPAIAFCLSLASTAFLALKRRLIFIGLIIVVQVVSIGLNGARVLLREAGELPEVALPEVAISVVPGGDVFSTKISPGQVITATVCFYKNGAAVVAAHKCGLSPGVLDVYTLLNDERVEGEVILMEDTPWGFAVRPLEPPAERQELPLGNARDVSIGETATCLTPRTEPFDVEIAGWTMREGRPYLVVSSPRKITNGMSGVPVVQNGRIIGFLAATWPLSARSPYIGYVSPAAAVYNELRDHLQAPP
jgi:hypothetical protein